MGSNPITLKMINSKKVNYDLKKRKIYATNEMPGFLKKTVINNEILTLTSRNKILCFFPNFTNSSTRLNNLCLKTERSRGVITEYKISRHNFKSLIEQRKLPGLKKAAW